MMALRIIRSRLRVRLARWMLVTGRRIVEQEERAWGLARAPSAWRVPNTP